MVSFANPLFLAALSAAALPVVIHFLTRPRPRRIPFPPFRLLVESGSSTQALNRLLQALLLALRVLCIASLALTFARPYLPASGAEQQGAGADIVLVVDASLSMQGTQGGVSLFRRACSQAAGVLRSLEGGTRVGLIFAGAKPRCALPDLSRNRALLHRFLSGATCTWERGNPQAALALASRMLHGKGQVYIFGDFQRTEWAACDLSVLGRSSVFLRPVTERPVPNVGLTAVSLAPARPLAGEEIELSCRVFNSQAQGVTRTVELELAGVSQSREVSLPPFRSKEVVFRFTLPNAGTETGAVRLEGDDLPADDTRFFAVSASQEVRVLLLSDGDPGDPLSPANLCALALSPSPYAESGVRVIRRNSEAVDQASLQHAEVFMLVSPLHLSPQIAGTLAKRVAQGASLIFFLHGPEAPACVKTLSEASRGELAPPFKLIRSVSGPEEGEPLAEVVTTRGPLGTFHSPQQGDLLSLRFFRHFLTQNDSRRKNEIYATYRDGSAALSFSPAGKGTAVYVNLPLAAGGGTLTASALFPVLVHELLRALRQGGSTGEVVPGRPWSMTWQQEEAAPGRLRVVGPGGKELSGRVVARGRTMYLALPPAEVPGPYRVYAGERQVAVGVVTTDPRESDTRILNARSFAEQARRLPGTGTAVAVLGGEGEVRWAGRDVPLWPALLLVAGCAWGLETVVLSFLRRRSVVRGTR